ncbi:MAG TPA: TlpA disulfide reductase family protein [Nocardioides sp.]|uniref:TlpA family protein disulfide reductase n=1 Tax=Nocardioides sp. TaxID=35761 RepID=UPI002C4DD426|nr:TlpA disulfide reductase family protein [Nocardioides sp.]HTW14274.1 TlpA disulfide reductase family protein [Nocardioides sp.]
MTRRLLSAALAGALLLLTTSCDGGGTNDGGYISGDSNVVQYAADKRGDPVEGVSGTTLDGGELDLADSRGKPVVVNVWWSGCGPCNIEMPMLTEAHAELGDQVDFVGINTRDTSIETARSFEQAKGVDYPSIYAADGKALLPFGSRAVRAMPTTLVLDREGRVAALIPGQVPGKVTLIDVVEDVLAEDA